jgi:hypothetical protein
MSDNYCDTSSCIVIEPSQVSKARSIIKRAEKEIEKEDDYIGIITTVETRSPDEIGIITTVETRSPDENKVWFRGDENANPDHMMYIADKIMRGLKIQKPFKATWSYTCSKPCLDQFSGGGAIINPPNKKCKTYKTTYVSIEQQLEELENKE